MSKFIRTVSKIKKLAREWNRALDEAQFWTEHGEAGDEPALEAAISSANKVQYKLGAALLRSGRFPVPKGTNPYQAANLAALWDGGWTQYGLSKPRWISRIWRP